MNFTIQKPKTHFVGQLVTVDGIDGFIKAVHPLGNGIYKGRHNAYYWVRTPELDYTEYVMGTKIPACRIFTSRSVSFTDAPRRLKDRTQCVSKKLYGNQINGESNVE